MPLFRIPVLVVGFMVLALTATGAEAGVDWSQYIEKRPSTNLVAKSKASPQKARGKRAAKAKKAKRGKAKVKARAKKKRARRK